MKSKKDSKRKNGTPKTLSIILIFVLSFYVFQLNDFVGLILAIIGGAWAFDVFTKSFLSNLSKKKLPIAVLYWMAMVFAMAIMFSFIQIYFYSNSMGYLKYGNCDSDNSFKTLSASEISSLEGAVPPKNTNYIYYNVVTLTTLGYGDICPEGTLFRWIAIFEVLVGLVINLFFVSIAIGEFIKHN